MKKWLKIVIIIICVILISFVLDLISIFTLNKPLFGIKIDNGDSVNIIYKGIFYDVYNCIEYSAPLIKSKGTKFNCTINVKEVPDLNEVDGVTMIIKKGTLTKTGATVIIIDTNKHKHYYGAEYRIDVKNNDSWKEVEKIGPAHFTAIAYLVDKNNKLELKQEWSNIYGELSEGEYRIVKDVCVNEGCIEKKEFSTQFTIE
jgi:hypothetical protein